MLEQRNGLHDLAGLAVAALRNLMRDPGLHDRVSVLVLQPFHGDDRLAGDLADTRLTGTHRLSIDMDGARPALRHPAAVLGARKTKFVAQDPEQRHLRNDVNLVLGAIDREFDHVGCPLADNCSSSLPNRFVRELARHHCLVSGRTSVFTNPASSCSIRAESSAPVISVAIDLTAAEFAILSRSETRRLSEHTRKISLGAEAESQSNFDQ